MNPAILNENTPGAAARLASIIVHEAFHILSQHSVPVSEQDERAAYGYEAGFICCAISYINSADPPLAFGDEMKEALCQQMRNVVYMYYCVFMGPVATLDWSCCDFEFDPYSCQFILPPPSSATAPPRPQLHPASLQAQFALQPTPIGLFEAALAPSTSSLTILLSSSQPGLGGSWSYDLKQQPEGVFTPLSLTNGNSANVYVAGRLEPSGESIIYDSNIDWNGREPVLNFDVIYRGTSFGDLVAIRNVKSINGCLAVFDYSMAQLSYVRISDGQVTPIASYLQYPELATMLGMVVDFSPASPQHGTSQALWFRLQQNQNVQHVDLSGTVTVNVIDDHGDGSVDDYFLTP